MHSPVTSRMAKVVSSMSTRQFSSKAYNPMVSAVWLRENMNDVKVVDCSWRMGGGDACQDEFYKGHIPGAQFFDCDKVADLSKAKPHTLPSPEVFAAGVGEIGITNEDTVVVYDTTGMLGAARGWLTFMAFGAKKVYVLEGGLPFWKAVGYQIEVGVPPKIAATKFVPQFNKEMFADMENVKCSLGKDAVMDARSSGRFHGTEPEPRAGLLSGHMPGALNVPYGNLLKVVHREGFTANVLKSEHELREIIEKTGVTQKDARIIASCGSGMTASTLYLVLYKLGYSNLALYDGSWTEYGNPQNKNAVVQ